MWTQLLSILRIFETENFEARASEAGNSEAPDSEADGEIRRLEGHLKEIQKRFQDAEHFKVKQTMRMKARNETKEIIVCRSFSDDNHNVIVSSDKRSVKNNRINRGYCFLNHPKIGKNQILKWTLRVPKFKAGLFDALLSGFIGMVIILE